MKHRSLLGVAFGFAIAACSAGSGPLEPSKPIQPDPPYSSQDPSTASGSCIGACGANMRCVGVVEGHAVDVVYGTVTSGSACGIAGQSTQLRCDGQIVSGGRTPKSEGTWTSGPGGGFVVCAANGECVTCVPTTDPPTPKPEPQPQPGDVDAGVSGASDAG